MKKTVSLILVIVVAGKLFSQDTLPQFTVVERGNKVIISWTNPYTNLIQLNVQRSYDSLKSYSTIFSAPSPELSQNGYTDTRKTTNRVYYRIFYVQQGGSYAFSKPKRADGSSDYASSGDMTNLRDINNSSLLNTVPGDKRVVTVKVRDVVLKQFSINAFRNFRDSILRLTKDTLYAINDTLVGVNPYTGPANWKASAYIFINKDGYINISLPLEGEKKYNVRFFEENGASLFEITNIKESPLIIDKSNFVHAGWFLFELYEDNKLKEKNKLYLPKEF